MKTTKSLLYIILCVGSLLTSCASDSNGDGKKKVTAKAQSSPYELLVVANKDWLKTDVGQTLVETVETPIEGLPQMEPNFRVTYINPDAFNGTFKGYSNVIFAEVGKKHSKAEMRIAHDEYCRPQLVVFLSAPDGQAFVKLMQKHAQQILDLFNAQEFAREHEVLEKKYSKAVMKQAKKQFGIEVKVPSDIDDIKVGKDFLWASDSKREFRTNVCIYTLPMRDLSLEEFVVARDSVMKINIPGGREDQWMETDSRTVTSRIVERNGQQVMEVRGLWDMKNDAMGGPFVCYVQADASGQKLLAAEGFVFAPEEKKRAMIRKLEAAIQTVHAPIE